MENIIFLKIEIFIFLLSLVYVIYYLLEKIIYSYLGSKKNTKNNNNIGNNKNIGNNNIGNNKNIGNKSITLNNKKKITFKKIKDNIKISEKNKQKITEILKRVKINSSKGYYDTSKTLIVEGLTLDKYNRELNIELASIYEKEKNYINAEYIYKDLLEILKVDFEIMKKLGYIYAMQNKLEDSLKIYENIHRKKMADDEVIDLLSEITFNMDNYKKSLKYINLFLISKPRNVEKLFMKAKCLEESNFFDEAKNIYKRILELQPYNTKAKNNIDKIYDK